MRWTALCLVTALTVGLAQGASAGTGTMSSSGHNRDDHVIFIPPPPKGGNGQDKDTLDTRFTTMPACRGIDPTDREDKLACLQGQPWHNPQATSTY